MGRTTAVLVAGGAGAAALAIVYGTKKFLCGGKKKRQNVIKNPYTGEVVQVGGTAVVPKSKTRGQVVEFVSREAAVETLASLATAQKAWAAKPLAERTAAIEAGAAFFEANAERIASDMTAAVGKPISQSAFEITAGVGKMRALCEKAASALAPETFAEGDFAYQVQRVAKGVVEIIAPWNYPIFTALNGVVPALLAGNAVALKHQSTPAIGDWFAKAFSEIAGAPLAHVHVDIPTSTWIGANVDMVAHRVFTGSVRGGRAVYSTLGLRALNPRLKNAFIGCSLELGGCDAAYVHGDLQGADLEHAVEFVCTVGRLHNAGQSCCAVKRALVHPKVLDHFVAVANANFRRQVCGDPLAPETTIGPLYGGAAACDDIFSVVLDARSKGARIVVAGEDCTGFEPTQLKTALIFRKHHGFFIRPTLLVGATPEMRCMTEEVFGPVLAVAEAPTDLDRALDLIGAIDFGLTSSVWTKDHAVADAFISTMTVGTCFVNWCNDVHPHVVWSGVGLSGNGAGAMGHEGFRVLTNPKSVVRRAQPMKFP